MEVRLAAALSMALWLAVEAAVAQVERPLRLFPQFVGTWVLDEATSTGRLLMTPFVPATLTISTTPVELTVARRLRLGPGNQMSDTPPPEIYRLDGSETWSTDSRTGVTLDRSLRFTLVADMLALTVRDAPRSGRRAFTQITDALEVDGGILKLHRQLTSMTEEGAILVMQEPTNNFRHTYVYRREPAAQGP